MSSLIRPRAWLVPAFVLLAAAPAAAQSRPSSALTTELAALMTSRQLDAVAAQNPDAPDRFVAALLVPGVQLLVVSAQYPAAAELQAQLAQRNYRDVYTALHQPSTQQTRFFLIDAGADGLRTRGDGVDVLYEKGTTQTLFDGHWKQQGLTEVVYKQRAMDAEAQYARLLSILAASLQAPGTSEQP